jgi:hypothetical protein
VTVKSLDPVDFVDQDRTLVFEDNFLWYISPHYWTATLTDTGTATALTTHGGGIAITPSDGTVTNNDEAYVGGTNKNIVPTNLKPIFFQAVVQYAEGATDDANVIVGLSSTSAANALLDDGGGPPASYSGIVFFKVDGGTNWNVEVSVGGTQTTAELTAVNSLTKTAKTAGGSAKQTLRFEFIPYSSTKAQVLFYIDGELVYKMDWTYTSVVAMAPIVGLKNGADTTVETLNVYNVKLKTLR